MSGKLNQSLDEIMKDKPAGSGGRRRGPRKAAVKSKTATTAIIAGGVQKKGRAPKPVAKAVAAAFGGESKISVSNLPEDVNDQLIREYFSTSVAPVKKVVLNYGPTGRSRGSAVVSFSKPDAAALAAKLDGTKVDGKPMRIEVLVGAAAVAPQKSLQERVSGKPKNAAKPKEAAGAKGAAAGAAKGGRNDKKKSGRAGKPKAKTAEELDAEMQDYFGGETTTNGTAQPAAAATNGGDTGMTDEVL